MAYDESLATRVREMLPSDAASKQMFGGIAFLLGGNMAVGVVDDRLVVRVGPDAYDDAMREPHAGEMDFTGRPMTGWVYVAPDGVAGEEDLAAWVDRGVRFASSLPAKR